MTMQTTSSWTLRVLLLAALALGHTIHVSAQAASTASRPGSLLAFGEFSKVDPAFGRDKNIGGAAGVDLGFHLRAFTPSLELRGTYATGNSVTETTYGGGIRVEKQYGRIHPYANLLISAGTITFKHPIIFPQGPYKSDNSTVFTYGGGADFDLTRKFALRAEYQAQHWNLGGTSSFTPTLLGVGVVYRIAP